MSVTGGKTTLRTLKAAASRQVLNVVLLGDPRVGKSTIVKHFLQKGRAVEVSKSGRTVNMVEVQFPNGLTKYIIFTEVQTMELSESNKDLVLDQKFDAIVVCYEHPNYLKKFLQEKQSLLRYPVPKMALYCKNDERLFDRKSMEIKDFSDLGLRIFAECSSRNGDFSNFTYNLQRLLENP
jgi:hypothetical protein